MEGLIKEEMTLDKTQLRALESLDVVYDDLEGSIFKNDYKIGRLIGSGSFATVHKVTNANHRRPMVVKISQKYNLFSMEVNTMKHIWRKSQSLFQKRKIFNVETPQVLEFGMLAILDGDSIP